MFIITAEQIKETALEIDYIIEEIIKNNFNYDSLSPLIINLFKSLTVPERDILIKSLKCIKEQKGNENFKNNIEKLEKMKRGDEKKSIFNNIHDSFESIYKNIFMISS